MSRNRNTMRPLNDAELEARRQRFQALSLRSERSVLLARHWLDIAGTSLVPERANLDPARMTAALPNVAVHRFEAPDRIVIRLAGTEFYHAYGRELTGSNYLDLVAPDRRAQASARLHTLIQHPCGLMATLIYVSRNGTVGKSESLGLPLVGPTGAIDMAIYVNDDLPHDSTWDSPNNAINFLDAERVIFLDIGAGVPPTEPPS